MQSCRAILRSRPRTFGARCFAVHEAAPLRDADARIQGSARILRAELPSSADYTAGETTGFLTGYYEPIVDGSRETDEYAHSLSQPADRRVAASGGRLQALGLANRIEDRQGCESHSKGGEVRRLIAAKIAGVAAVWFHSTIGLRSKVACSRAAISRSSISRIRSIRSSSRFRVGDLPVAAISAMNYDSQNGEVWMAVLRVVVHAHHIAVRETDTRRTLNLDEERIDRILEMDDLEIAALEHAIFDPARS